MFICLFYVESDLQENDVLQQCFINLEQKLYTNHKKLNNLREDMNAGLLQNETIPSPRITRSNAFVSRSANPETVKIFISYVN